MIFPNLIFLFLILFYIIFPTSDEVNEGFPAKIH